MSFFFFLLSATRPLLRQIENLQSTFAAQSALWEKREKSLMDKISKLKKNQQIKNNDLGHWFQEFLIEMKNKTVKLVFIVCLYCFQLELFFNELRLEFRLIFKLTCPYNL